MSQQKLFKKMFWNEKGQLVLAQKPNLPIIVWLIATIVGFFVTGDFRTVVSMVGFVAIVIWAGWELVSGVNYFRRILGAIVLVMSLFGRFK